VQHAFSPQLESFRHRAGALGMERTNLHKRIRALGLSRRK
jgi:transcriptional regulator of acetoin/glycerol metabolism